jgi:glycerophosphoryl diester phosphodiesterase
MPVRVPLLLLWARANTLSLHHRLCSRAAVATAHRLGAPVLAWTVNDPDGVRRVTAAGVDGIVSDDPEMAVATLLAL